MQVRDIMTEDVRACCADATGSDAVKLMWDNDCGIVPVVDSDNQVVGAITDRDIVIACWSRDVAPSRLPVCDAMTREVQCCAPDDTVARAEQLMEKHQVRRLPVIDHEGRLCGIISLADIARASRPRARGAEKADVRPEKVVEAYAAVCQPRGEHLHA